jgi:hypothetical protein
MKQAKNLVLFNRVSSKVLDSIDRSERITRGLPLGSWKEIAAYLGRTVRTCQRLETRSGLPVYRLNDSPRAHVFTYTGDLDAWLSKKTAPREVIHAPRPRILLLATGALLLAAAVISVILLG